MVDEFIPRLLQFFQQLLHPAFQLQKQQQTNRATCWALYIHRGHTGATLQHSITSDTNCWRQNLNKTAAEMGVNLANSSKFDLQKEKEANSAKISFKLLWKKNKSSHPF